MIPEAASNVPPVVLMATSFNRPTMPPAAAKGGHPQRAAVHRHRPGAERLRAIEVERALRDGRAARDRVLMPASRTVAEPTFSTEPLPVDIAVDRRIKLADFIQRQRSCCLGWKWRR